MSLLGRSRRSRSSDVANRNPTRKTEDGNATWIMVLAYLELAVALFLLLAHNKSRAVRREGPWGSLFERDKCA